MASVVVCTTYLAIAIWIAYYLFDKARNRCKFDIYRLAYPVSLIAITSTYRLALTNCVLIVEFSRNLVIGSGVMRKRFSMIIIIATPIRNGWVKRAQC